MGLVHAFKPLGIADVIVGNADDFAFHFFGCNLFYLFSGYARVNRAAFANGTFQHNGPGSNNGIAVHHGAIHYNGAHAHQHIVVQRTAMHQCIVPNGYIVADNGFAALVRAMDDGTILHIDLVAQADAVDIAADNGVEPHTARITHFHVAHNSSVGCNKAGFAPAGCFVFYR